MAEIDPDMLDPNPRIPNTVTSNVATSNTTLRAKTLREQQAVLSLQALAQQDRVSENVLGNQIADLTDKLILGAGEDVVGLAEKEEREQLEVFQGLITRRLSILRGGVSGNGNDNRSVKSGRSDGDGSWLMELGIGIRGPVQEEFRNRNRSRNQRARAVRGGV